MEFRVDTRAGLGRRVGVGMLPAPAVVETAAQLAVVDGRGAAGRPGMDVVALAAFRGLLTAAVCAALIANFESAADGPGEPAGPAQSTTREGPSNTTCSINASSNREATVPGLTTVPPASWQMRPLKVSYPTKR